MRVAPARGASARRVVGAIVRGGPHRTPASADATTRAEIGHSTFAHSGPSTYATTARRVRAPAVRRSTANPGVTKSRPPRSGPIGTRLGAVQVRPSADDTSAMSFVETPGRHLYWKLQSGQASQTRPSPATSADGSGAARRRATGENSACATTTGESQVAPPSVDRTDSMRPSRRYGTSSVPSG